LKVICKYTEVTDELIKKLDLDENVQCFHYTITKGKEYVVLALSYAPSLNLNSEYPVIQIKDDSGYLYSHPLFLFNIVDDRVSKYWHIRFDRTDGWLKMWPESFYQEYYHDDLSNDVIEIEKDFKRVSKLLEEEIY